MCSETHLEFLGGFASIAVGSIECLYHSEYMVGSKAKKEQ